MDAKPQKPLRPLRVFNDENNIQQPYGGQTLRHKRHQSSPNLSVLAAHAATKPSIKRVFGENVSNTLQLTSRAVKDDSALPGKKLSIGDQKSVLKRLGRTDQENLGYPAPSKDLEKRGTAFLRPAQRPLRDTSTALQSIQKDISAVAKSIQIHGQEVKDVREPQQQNVIPRKQLPDKKEIPNALPQIPEVVTIDAKTAVQFAENTQPGQHIGAETRQTTCTAPADLVGSNVSLAAEIKEDVIEPTPSIAKEPPAVTAPDDSAHRELLEAIGAVSINSTQAPAGVDVGNVPEKKSGSESDIHLLNTATNIKGEVHHENLVAAEPIPASKLNPIAENPVYSSSVHEAAPAPVANGAVNSLPTTIVQPSSVIALDEYKDPTVALDPVYDHYDTIGTGPSALYDGEDDWVEDEEEHFDDEGFVTARSGQFYDQFTGNLTTTLMAPDVDYAAQLELAGAGQFVALTRDPLEVKDEFDDPTMVAEYGDEIFQYYRELERKMQPNPHYMDFQTEIQWSMRTVLMDWLVQVHMRFNLLPETLFLTVNYVDRFLSAKVVSLNKLQLVGATALFVASKYEEINCPSVSEICYMVDDGYTMEEVLKAERFMLSMLQFELGWPGPMNFLRRVSKADDYDLETRTVSKYLLEVTIMDQVFIGCTPSYLAAGAHCLSRQLLEKGDWTPAHTYWSGYTYSQLYPLLIQLLHCLRSPLKHHLAVFEKHRDGRRSRGASRWVNKALCKGFQLLPLNNQIAANQACGLHVKQPGRPIFGSFW